MKVRCGDGEIDLSPDVIAALVALMAATCEMMRARDPAAAWCWRSGRCIVTDFGRVDAFEFEYGALDDFPIVFEVVDGRGVAPPAVTIAPVAKPRSPIKAENARRRRRA